MMACARYQPSVNDRYRGCERCGLLPKYHPQIDPTRDLAFEAKFLNDALEAAGRLTGVHNPSYPLSVSARLDVGRRRYGDANYMGKDNLVEVLEETPDIASYAMLELQKQRRLKTMDPDTLDELYLDLVAAAAYGAAADFYARRAMRTRQGEE